MPRHVKLYVEYFQMSRGNKRLVLAQMQFFDLCFTAAASPGQVKVLNQVGSFAAAYEGIGPCNYTWNGGLNDTEYMFELTFVPANWINLLNYFALNVTLCSTPRDYFVLRIVRFLLQHITHSRLNIDKSF